MLPRCELRGFINAVRNGWLCSHWTKPVARQHDRTAQTARLERRKPGTCSGAGGTSQWQRSPRHEPLKVTFAAKCVRPFCCWQRDLSLVHYVWKKQCFVLVVRRTCVLMWTEFFFVLFVCDRRGFLAVCIVTHPLSFVHLAESVISGRSFCALLPPFVGKRRRERGTK